MKKSKNNKKLIKRIEDSNQKKRKKEYIVQLQTNETSADKKSTSKEKCIMEALQKRLDDHVKFLSGFEKLSGSSRCV